MKLQKNLDLIKQCGFSLLEMMISLVILGLVTGAVFAQMDVAQKRMAAESTKLDDFQQARDFVDQFFRDINQAGYPNTRMIDPTSLLWVPPLTTQVAYPFASPYMNDSRLAVGLVRIDANDITFEADSNGDGNPESVRYTINGSGTCALCLQRSQVDKVNGVTPWNQATNWGTEVNDVLSNPIFRYYDANGNLIGGLPIDISTAAGAQTIATVKTIQISLRIQNPTKIDMQTGQPIESVFEGEVSLNNCSMAFAGQAESCQ